MAVYSVLTVILSIWTLVLAIPTPTEDNIAVPLPSCTNAPWKTGSCCAVVKEKIKGFEGEQWAYKCDYNDWAYLLSGQAGFGCSKGVTICCTKKGGTIVTPGDGSPEVSIPDGFTCEGL